MKNLINTWLNKTAYENKNIITVSDNCLTNNSIWQDTGKVYYVLETLKISYLSNFGHTTFESLSPNTALSLIEDIYHPGNLNLAPKVTAGITSPVHISVCGITWQKNSTQLRIKAIPEAATLRTQEANFANSQALFQHGSRTVDVAISSLSEHPTCTDSFRYNNINLKQFIKQLEHVNSFLPASLQRKAPICRNNFKKIYSDHENTVLSGLTAIDGL
ncbi:hypothetical protein BGP78_00855 [Pseudoalteromonas sp. MSK9-3]|uniref:hypothetical protein n=1 Tax=Pseudoalteromonas sp. MSK9-3 TaxID=1897633 RepID=UPI000E6C5E8E|nr:hypothetical protein [Pseudoalteromonas sp. MSK9-3]RJE77584.1 hypothetical protein BGP78_00855 [Pseudoalteromonas sp. MSK9-3]